MLQLSLDGKRLYVTNSLFSTWDKGATQFCGVRQKSVAMLVTTVPKLNLGV